MIYVINPFYKENLILDIMRQEYQGYVDEIHIIEANRTFQNKEKEYFYKSGEGKELIHYHAIDVSGIFHSCDLKGKLSLLPYRLYGRKYEHILAHPNWWNEGYQRSQCTKYIEPSDQDIVIASDIDEIIDTRYFYDLIEMAERYGIVTCRLHFTLFYFNLFSTDWPGAPDYSYRLFVMTGAVFRKIVSSGKFGMDKLRKLGEQGKLVNHIKCYEKKAGFHHSWLGDEEFVFNKLRAYAHIVEHKDRNSMELVRKCLEEGISLFPGHQLMIDDSIPLLQVIENNRESYSRYFIQQGKNGQNIQ